MSKFNDRIIETKKLKASDLTDHSGNWRVHPNSQREVVEGILKEVGKAGVLSAWYSARNEGKLTLFDGHLRKSFDPDEEWTVAITDLTDQEADKMLILMDPMAGMAEVDGTNLAALIDTTNTDDMAVRELLRQLENKANNAEKEEAQTAAGEDKAKPEESLGGPPEMDLLPFEHYDYVLLMFRNEMDWAAAHDVFGLERRKDPRKTGKIGLSRVLDGKTVVSRIAKLELEAAQRKPDENRNPKQVAV